MKLISLPVHLTSRPYECIGIHQNGNSMRQRKTGKLQRGSMMPVCMNWYTPTWEQYVPT